MLKRIFLLQTFCKKFQQKRANKMDLRLYKIPESIIETPIQTLTNLNKEVLINYILLAEAEKDEIFFHCTYPYQGNVRNMLDELNTFISTVNKLLENKK